jgi:ABC-type multidrug transport system ATPase subunit
MQDDRLIETLTVKETLHFAASFKLKLKSKEERILKVNELIYYLKLERC